ncbi:MAG TPA: hypothetical protein VEH09_03025, partial [Thermodesulfobacteriota bacterium]|nr:hypothetical protein [Thermodesulfobacteriota bacterium]
MNGATPIAKMTETSSTSLRGAKTWGSAKYVLIFILAFVYLIPVIILILTSFKTQVQIFTKTPTLIFMPTLENYRTVLWEQGFTRYMVNSLLVGLIATLFTLIIGGFAAYALVRF